MNTLSFFLLLISLGGQSCGYLENDLLLLLLLLFGKLLRGVFTGAKKIIFFPSTCFCSSWSQERAPLFMSFFIWIRISPPFAKIIFSFLDEEERDLDLRSAREIE